jgi:enamine deaminase RidA (YjgF/YER057c/UK114 family)
VRWTEWQVTFPAFPKHDERWKRLFEQVCGSPQVVHLDLFGGQQESLEPGGVLLNRCSESMETVILGSDTSLPRCLQARVVTGISMTPVYEKGRLIGRMFEDADARYCLLGGIRPSNVSAPRGEQAREVLSIIQRTLQRHGMEFCHVIRTWYYLDRILDWYGEFNRVRTSFFEEIEMGVMPASTGVGAANPHGEALSAKVIAILPKTPAVRVRKAVSPLQGEAFSYGSAFSRAIEVSDAASRTLYISGTASIDQGGHTVHTGDVAQQIEMTMEVVEAILGRCDMGLEDMTRGVVYLKDGGDAPHWARYCERRGLNDLPVAVAQSDVCRKDLLFEIELDAASQHPPFIRF